MFSKIRRLFSKSDERQLMILEAPGENLSGSALRYSSTFQPTSQTALLDGEADWDLPDGLEEAATFEGDNSSPTSIQKIQTLLSDGLEGVVVKRLSAVESDPAKSNQHEFNGSASLRRLLGENDRKHITTQFIRLDDTGEAAAAFGELSWYDARRKHPTRTEFRLYYRENVVTASMSEGDLFFLVLRKDETALVISASHNCGMQGELFQFFGIEEGAGYEFKYEPVTAGRVFNWSTYGGNDQN